MVTAEDIKKALEDFAPAYLAEDFDNVGLLVGESTKEVKTVLLALDADENTADEAVRAGADMIVSHHPVIFNAEKSVTDKTPLGRTLIKLISNSIAVCSVHTNMDKAEGGLNDLMVKKLGLMVDHEYIHDADKCMRVCRADTTLSKLCLKLKSEYDLDFVRCTGNPDRRIKRVGLCTGGGRSMTDDVIASGCDVYISGDLHYADIRKLVFAGVDFIEIGHFNSEVCVTQIFKSIINKAYPEIRTIISKEMDVFLNTF